MNQRGVLLLMIGAVPVGLVVGYAAHALAERIDWPRRGRP